MAERSLIIFILRFYILLRVLSRLLEEPSLATTLQGVYFIYILLLLHGSALVGHLQAEYTVILGSCK
jgi:hypothetical protein